MPNIQMPTLYIATVITLSLVATFSANAQEKMGPPAPSQTQSQKNWVRTLARNKGAKYKGGIITTVNGRETIAYPRGTNGATIR